MRPAIVSGFVTGYVRVSYWPMFPPGPLYPSQKSLRKLTWPSLLVSEVANISAVASPLWDHKLPTF